MTWKASSPWATLLRSATLKEGAEQWEDVGLGVRLPESKSQLGL